MLGSNYRVQKDNFGIDQVFSPRFLIVLELNFVIRLSADFLKIIFRISERTFHLTENRKITNTTVANPRIFVLFKLIKSLHFPQEVNHRSLIIYIDRKQILIRRVKFFYNTPKHNKH